MALGQYHSLMEPKLPQDTESRHADKYIIRFPDGMRDRLKEEAKTNNRTLNAEIVARLQNSFDAQESATKSHQDDLLPLSAEMIERIAQKAGEAAATRVLHVNGSSPFELGTPSVISAMPTEAAKKSKK